MVPFSVSPLNYGTEYFGYKKCHNFDHHPNGRGFIFLFVVRKGSFFDIGECVCWVSILGVQEIRLPRQIGH